MFRGEAADVPALPPSVPAGVLPRSRAEVLGSRATRFRMMLLEAILRLDGNCCLLLSSSTGTRHLSIDLEHLSYLRLYLPVGYRKDRP